MFFSQARRVRPKSVTGGVGAIPSKDAGYPLRVLLWMPSEHVIPGGHRVQMYETGRALRDLGVCVREDISRQPDLNEIDLVHAFGLTAEDVRYCRNRGRPVLLSTIYWEQSYRYYRHRSRLIPRVVRDVGGAARAAKIRLRGMMPVVNAAKSALRREMELLAAFEAADLLLPNSYGEMRAIENEIGPSTPSRVVPNGVNPSIFLADQPTDDRRQAILCVGRIEPHKNQLGVIEALRGSGLDLVIVGPSHPHHRQYLERCHEAGAGWVSFHEECTQEEIALLLRSARVHVLASGFETTGLVSLEAGLSGCRVVSTSRGYAREYLGDDAFYCDPETPNSILRAVNAAIAAPTSRRLQERILAHYTWAHAGRATLDAYNEVLSRDDRWPLAPAHHAG